MENNNQSKKNSDEIWDTELEDPANTVFFDKLDQQVDDALSKGEFFEGDFSEDDLK